MPGELTPRPEHRFTFGLASIVPFLTVYAGWYRGSRTTHIHTTVQLDRSTLLTTQLFFDEEVNAAV